MISTFINFTYPLLFSEIRKKQFEKIIFFAAIITFIIHFAVLVFMNTDLWASDSSINADLNPISAIYTPFTIILLYEIYLLIYYLPMSITIYLGKQYKIIALIFVRKLFSDLANISSSLSNWDYGSVKPLLVSLVGLFILCFLIFLFYKLSGLKQRKADENTCKDIKSRRFVITKKYMALGLMLLFVYLFIRSLFELGSTHAFINIENVLYILNDMNNNFFNTFFTALILTEVLLLLFTFDLSDEFSKVIRNSGFIISTILLKLSFQATGITNIIIILIAVGFGVSMLVVDNLFQKLKEK